MFPDFSQLEVLGKSLTDFMDRVKKELAEIRIRQDVILHKLNSQDCDKYNSLKYTDKEL